MNKGDPGVAFVTSGQAQALYEGHGYQRDIEFYSYIKPL